MWAAFFTDTILLFWIAIIFVFIMLIVAVVCYNSITRNKNLVISSWADVIAYERQKNNVLSKMEEIVKKYQEYERDLHLQITELRTALNKIKPYELNNKILKKVEDQTRSLVKGVKVALENYPDLKTSSLMQNFMHQIGKQQENIVAAITIFNKNVEEFNNEIQTFPGHIVNNYVNKQKEIKPFLDKKALDPFEYKLNL